MQRYKVISPGCAHVAVPLKIYVIIVSIFKVYVTIVCKIFYF